ncbi:hypothetical protein NPIL_393091 [Nephila pilipes]|uniref:Uncharacterized protein n=1 Tax=Nephila pilipes TaxID=299642 RepID=A0A8X6NRQ3_NEPPI|nr:hypothetical protein NPIL_393091 [Nephila pilipes]
MISKGSTEYSNKHESQHQSKERSPVRMNWRERSAPSSLVENIEVKRRPHESCKWRKRPIPVSLPVGPGTRKMTRREAADESGVLSREVDPTFRPYTITHLAIKTGHTETSKVLIEKGANVNLVDQCGCTPLELAVDEGKGADVNAVNQNGTTPLHFAAVGDHTEIVKALVAKGADVNSVGEDKCTPLHYADVEGNT